MVMSLWSHIFGPPRRHALALFRVSCKSQTAGSCGRNGLRAVAGSTPPRPAVTATVVKTFRLCVYHVSDQALIRLRSAVVTAFLIEASCARQRQTRHLRLSS